MVKYEKLGLEDAIDNFLSIKQKENARNIRKAVRRKKRKDLTLGERISAFFDLHFHKSSAIDIAELISSYKTFNTPMELYTLPPELKQELEYVGSYTTDSVFYELSAAINSALMRSQDELRVSLAHKNNELLKSLKKAKLESKYVTYWEDGKPVNASLLSSIVHLGNKKLYALHFSEQSSAVTFNTKNANEIDVPLSEVETYLTDIEDMLRKGEIQESDITKNIQQIRIIFRKRAVLEELNNKIWKIVCSLRTEKKENSVDFSSAIKLLQGIYDKNRREISMCDSYLMKFDFASLQERVTWVRDKREQEAVVRQSLEEMNQISSITPRNKQVVKQINSSEVITQEAKTQLRHMAVHELQVAGLLPESHQHVAGVVVYHSGNEEEQKRLICQKIEEMISIASQNPEERAVSYLNSMGTGALTVDDLDERHLEDYRSSFGDDSYSFDVPRVRTLKEIIDTQRMQKATAIYGEYLKYRAALKDETSISFSDYARVLYKQNYLNLSMVSKSALDMNESLEISDTTQKVH